MINSFVSRLGLLICAAQCSVLCPDMHSWALETIAAIYNEQYKDAEATAAKIIKKYPDHPAGYFFTAAAIDSWMAAHLSDAREDDFYSCCDKAIDKADKMLDRNPRDEWAHFFKGGAEGCKGAFEFRHERWITAGRHGWKGVSILQKLRDQHCGIPDCEYGIGCYEYWRSALAERLWWMPRVKDRRAHGIEKLLDVQKSGIYTRASASGSLIDIFLNEKRYAEALAVAAEAEQRYPNCRAFTLGRIKAGFGLGQFEEAAAACRQLLARAGKDPDDGHAFTAVCHFWIARIDSAIGSYTDCIAECSLMRKFPVTDDTKDLLENYFLGAKRLREAAVTALRNRAQRQLAEKKQ
jgi:tetratricopeptide (TPR) repeat protein